MSFTEDTEKQIDAALNARLARFIKIMNKGYSSLLSPWAGALSCRHPVRGLNFMCRPCEQRTAIQQSNSN